MADGVADDVGVAVADPVADDVGVMEGVADELGVVDLVGDGDGVTLRDCEGVGGASMRLRFSDTACIKWSD